MLRALLRCIQLQENNKNSALKFLHCKNYGFDLIRCEKLLNDTTKIN